MSISTLDHGDLNVPLAKRGNNDAQIDAYKAQQAATAKSICAERAAAAKSERAAAKVRVQGLPESEFARLGQKLGLTVKSTRARKRRVAHWSLGTAAFTSTARRSARI